MGSSAAAAAHTNAAAAAIARHWNSAAAALKPSAEARLAELTQFAEIAVTAAKSGQLPDLAEVPQQVLLTGGAAVSLAFLLLLPRGRRLVIGSLDTALATALCLALLVLLLGLPLGALYLLARGVFAAAAALVDSVPGLVKLLPLLAHST